jgi:ABC-type nitrate/sulfonate/bicarbonate transport system permease component
LNIAVLDEPIERSTVVVAKPRTRLYATILPWLAPVVGVLVIAGSEELLSRTGLISPSKFPPASRVLGALAQEIGSGAIIEPVSRTLLTWAVSLVIAFFGAVVIGTVLGLSRTLLALCAPIIEFLRPVPATALIPLVILAIGANMRGAMFLTVFGTIWQILPIVIRATAIGDPVAQDTARVFGFTAWQRLRWVTFPAMEPYLLTALRIGASAALVILVGMELLVGITGIGRKIALSYDGENLRLMYAYVLVSGVLGAGVNLLLNTLIARRMALRGGRSG